MPKHPKKKAPAKKAPVKRTTRKKTSVKRKPLGTYFLWAFFMIIILSAFAWLGYFIGTQKHNPYHAGSKEKELYSTEELLHDLSEIKKTMSKVIEPLEIHIKTIPAESKKEENRSKKPKHTEKPKVEEKSKTKTNKVSKEKKTSTDKPKLVIIIDDVHTRVQLHAIKTLGMKLTPSIFPPYDLAKQSHLLARGLSHYMIHLPMESGSKKFNTQYKTLKTRFTKAQIVERVKEIRKLFPHARYLNNHTGSVFTSDYKAMRQLYVALKREGFTFVDSMTIGTSKVAEIASEFGDKYRKRDIFIDNVHETEAIHKQLSLAVAKAKKNGYAIAIGHPHATTIKALSLAKPLFKDVELVYIETLYEE